MRFTPVMLHDAPEVRVVRLRELNGCDERSVGDTSTETAIRLLDRLISLEGAATALASTADLTSSDRDRLLAAVYTETFGDRIESTVTCRRCESPFDLHFSLAELRGTMAAETGRGAERYPDNTYRLPGTPRFRLPTGRDELAIAWLSPAEARDQLRRRCLVEESHVGDEALEKALQQIAPILDVELGAQCAECGTVQMVHFDIQSYLLRALLNEHRRLIADVHRLAAAFTWGFQDILSLSRSERRALVDLVQADRTQRLRV